MNQHSIRGLSVPVIIPLRGRGHIETVCDFDVVSDGMDVDTVLRQVYALAKHTLSLADCVKFTSELRKSLGSKSLQVQGQFWLPIERVEQEKLSTGYLRIPVFYTAQSLANSTRGLSSLTMTLPLLHIGVGKLQLWVGDDHKGSSEDLYDLVHKTLQFETMTGVDFKFESARSVKEVLELLRKRLRSETDYGRVLVTYTSPSGFYHQAHDVSWGRPITRFHFKEVTYVA